MTPFNFNEIYVIESLNPKEQTGKELYDDLLRWKVSKKLEAELIQVEDKLEFYDAIFHIIEEHKKFDYYPILHIEAHEQFLNACDLMSVSEKHIKDIRDGSYASIEKEVKTNKKKAVEKRHELEEIQQRLNAVEEKWFRDEINKDTYDRWYSIYCDHILTLTASIERLSINQGKAFEILESNLDLLGDIRHIYDRSNTLQKREFVNMVFDGNLYYQEGIYRTPTMMDIFSHNASN